MPILTKHCPWFQKMPAWRQPPFCPALSDRDILYELYYTDKTTEYIALDLRTGSTDFNVDDYLNNDRYETIYYKAFQIAVFRDLQYNDEKWALEESISDESMGKEH